MLHTAKPGVDHVQNMMHDGSSRRIRSVITTVVLLQDVALVRITSTVCPNQRERKRCTFAKKKPNISGFSSLRLNIHPPHLLVSFHLKWEWHSSVRTGLPEFVLVVLGGVRIPNQSSRGTASVHPSILSSPSVFPAHIHRKDSTKSLSGGSHAIIPTSP